MRRKLLLAVALMSAVGASHAEMNVSTEVQNKNALVEEFTGIQCVYCPYAHRVVSDLMDVQGDKVYAIAYHAGGFAAPGSDQPDYRIPAGVDVNNYWEVSGNPAGIINRQGPANGAYSSWATVVRLETEKVAPVNLYMASSYDESTRTLSIDVEGYYTADVDADFNMLTIALTENNVMGPQKGGGAGDEYFHQHMLRDFVTPTWGDTITSCKKGDFFERHYEYVIPETVNDVPVNPALVELVAFVCEDKENLLNVTGCTPDYPERSLPLDAELIEPRIPITSSYGANYIDVVVNNRSTEEITSATFLLTFNREEHSLDWTGSIAPLGKSEIRIPVDVFVGLKESGNTYYLQLTTLNGSEFKSNRLSFRFDAPYEVTPTVRVDFATDEYADENRFFIQDADGNVVHEFGPYPAGTEYEVSEFVNLDPLKTYAFVITDSWTNGIIDNYFNLYDANGNIISEGDFYEGHGAQVFFTTGAYNVSTELQNRKALVEEYTGIGCGNCPDAHILLDDLSKTQGDKFYAVAYHTGHYAEPAPGWPDFRTTAGDEIAEHFVPDGFPSGMVSRERRDDVVVLSRAYWTTLIHSITDEVSPVNLWMGSYYNPDTRMLTVDIEGYYTSDVDVDFNTLNVVITQDNLLGPQNGASMGANYVHNHVMRHRITPLWGDTITSCKTGDTFRKSYTWEVPADIKGVVCDPAYFEVLAFVCRDTEKVLNITGGRPYYPGLYLPIDAEIAEPLIPVNDTYAYNYYELFLINNSTEDIYEAGFDITLNGELYLVDWSGHAPARARTFITIPFSQSDKITVANDFEIKLGSINYNFYDGNAVSGSFQDPVVTTPRNKFIIKTDNCADENHYYLKDMSGKIIHEFGPYPVGVVTQDTVTLDLEPNKTYCFEVIDEWGDGIFDPRGTYKIYNDKNKLVAQNLEIKAHGARSFITTSEESAVDKIESDNAISIYYNGDNDAIVVSVANVSDPYRVSVYNTAGQCVYQGNATQQLNIPIATSGVYVVKVDTDAEQKVAKVIANN